MKFYKRKYNPENISLEIGNLSATWKQIETLHAIVQMSCAGAWLSSTFAFHSVMLYTRLFSSLRLCAVIIGPNRLLRVWLYLSFLHNKLLGFIRAKLLSDNENWFSNIAVQHFSEEVHIPYPTSHLLMRRKKAIHGTMRVTWGEQGSLDFSLFRPYPRQTSLMVPGSSSIIWASSAPQWFSSRWGKKGGLSAGGRG